jgi:hypothetical protein
VRFLPVLSAVGAIARRIPGRHVIGVLRSGALVHSETVVEGVPVRQMVEQVIEDVEARMATTRDRLRAMRTGDPWDATVFPVAWGIADGVNLVMTPLDSGTWRGTYGTLRRPRRDRLSIAVDPAGGDRRACLEVASSGGHLTVRDRDRTLHAAELEPGPETLVFDVPRGCTALALELRDVDLDQIGFRELILLP